MLKIDAINLFGGRNEIALSIGCTPQAISAWPEILPRRIADRVIAAAVRKGKTIPPGFLDPGAGVTAAA